MPIVWRQEVGEHEVNALDEGQETFFYRWGCETVLFGATKTTAQEILKALHRAQHRELYEGGD